MRSLPPAPEPPLYTPRPAYESFRTRGHERSRARESGGFGRFEGGSSPAQDHCVEIAAELLNSAPQSEVPGTSSMVRAYLSGLVESIREDRRQQARVAVSFAEVMLLWGVLAIGYSELYREDLYGFAMHCGGAGLLALAVIAVPALAKNRREGSTAGGQTDE